MHKNTIFLIVVVIVMVGGGLSYYLWRQSAPLSMAPSSSITASTTVPASQTTSDGVITFSQLSQFGLAVSNDQVPTSYIPPCSNQFDYCLYYTGDVYQGTNFEDAGVSISKRPDIATERLCLDTPPAGYSAQVLPQTSSVNEYSASVFAPIGQGAAGHYVTGAVYRLWVRASLQCYEFQTRIVQSAYDNYPPGSIKEFTATAEQALAQLLDQELQTVVLNASGTKVVFPLPQSKG